MAEDFYDILGVRRDSSQKEIESAYKKLALEFHPDRHPNNPLAYLAEEKMKKVNEAYSVLKDPVSRRQYDLGGLRGAPPPQQSQPTQRAQDYRSKYDPPFGGYAYTKDNWGEQAGSSQGPTSDLGDLRNRAQVHFATREFRKALPLIDKILIMTPDDATAHNFKAMVLMELGDFRNALPPLNNAIRLNPSTAAYYFNRGVCFMGIRHPQQALTDLEKAMNMEVDNPQYLIGYAAALQMTGQHVKAKGIADYARSIDPHHPAVQQFYRNTQARQNMRTEYYTRPGCACSCCPLLSDCLCTAMCCDACCIPGGCCVIG